jgi:formylglycine-generating enzyme required for sulfatase activity
MVEVKGDSYVFGPHGGWPRPGTERKSKHVSLKRFFIDKYEVTNADYMTWFRTLDDAARTQRAPRTWVKSGESSWAYPEGRSDHPVTGVSFDDALAYAHAVGKRLPTEEEWEAAARGVDGRAYPWGADYAAGLCNDRESGLDDTAPVGSYPDGASPFGCHDMAGNVEEWTSSTAEGDAVDAPLESTAVQMVIRGGNFNSNTDGVAATFRWKSPGSTTRKANLGFRCAQDPPKKR